MNLKEHIHYIDSIQIELSEYKKDQFAKKYTALLEALDFLQTQIAPDKQDVDILGNRVIGYGYDVGYCPGIEDEFRILAKGLYTRLVDVIRHIYGMDSKDAIPYLEDLLTYESGSDRYESISKEIERLKNI